MRQWHCNGVVVNSGARRGARMRGIWHWGACSRCSSCPHSPPSLARRQKHLNVYPSPCMPWRAFPEQGNAAAARSILVANRGAAGVCGAPGKNGFPPAPRTPSQIERSTAEKAGNQPVAEPPEVQGFLPLHDSCLAGISSSSFSRRSMAAVAASKQLIPVRGSQPSRRT